MEQKKKISILILIICTTLFGCLDNGIQENSTGTVQPSISFPEPDLSTPTDSIIPTVTQVPNYSQIKEHCLINEGNIPDDVELSGSLVGYNGILNFETGQEIKFDSGKPVSLTISTEGGLVANQLEPNEYSLINSFGEEVNRVTIPTYSWTRPAYWLDSNNIVFATENDLGDPVSIIFELSTGQTTEILSERFPDFIPIYDYIGYYWADFGSISRSSISPDKKFIVYTAYSSDQMQLVLWDLEIDEEVARIEGQRTSTFPWWSPDSQYFITALDWGDYQDENSIPYIDGNEIVRVSTSGEIERLTFLTADFDSLSFHYVWSPDGNQIAFTLDNFGGQEYPYNRYPSEPGNLAILDLTTRELTNYCLNVYGPLVWSPDGEYLAVLVSALDTEEGDFLPLYIVGLKEKTTWVVPGYQDEPKGWMNNNP